MKPGVLLLLLLVADLVSWLQILPFAVNLSIRVLVLPLTCLRFFPGFIEFNMGQRGEGVALTRILLFESVLERVEVACGLFRIKNGSCDFETAREVVPLLGRARL